MNNRLEYATVKDWQLFCLPGNMQLPESFNAIGAIGKSGDNFENVWWAVSQPGGQYYIPDPGPPLDCPTMETYRESMRNSRDYWTALVGRGGLNSEENYYATLIIDYYTNRMQQYADVMLRSCTTPGTGTQGPATALPAPAPPSDSGGDIIPVPTDGTAPTDTTTTAQPNYLLLGGLGLAAVVLWPKKKGKKKVSGSDSSLLTLVAIGAGAYLLIKNASGGSVTSERQALINDATQSESSSDASYIISVYNRMTDSEIKDTYNFIFNYVHKNIQVPQGSALYNAILAISNKYQIFT